MSVDLLLWGEPARPLAWGLGSTTVLAPWADNPAAAASALEGAFSGARQPDWWMVWDPALGDPLERVVAQLVAATADVVHAGLLLGQAGLPAELDLVQPTWWFVVDPPPSRPAMSWRLSLRAWLVRAEVVRQLGHVDPAFGSMAGAGLDLGWRYLARGAILFHDPGLLGPGLHDPGLLGPCLLGRCPATPAPPATIPATDRDLFLLRHYPRKWAAYVAARRAVAGPVRQEVRSFRAARRLARTCPPPRPPDAVFLRPAGAGTDSPGRPTAERVSVILPTLGRPELVARVLDDLRAQTVAPAEVICVDQNGPPGPGATAYEGFADLPLTVIRQDGTGQWRARNEAVARATGDVLLFVDDDSRVAPDFVAQHLLALARYGADVSAGGSISAVGAPVPESYGFFRAADQFDSGNALVRRALLERLGAFDRQYDRMPGGDGDFGMRAYLDGALVVHNPLAARAHLKAQTGGLRTFGSLDSYRVAGRFTPRPRPSVVYYAKRHLSPRQAREALLIGLVQSAVPYHLKRRASTLQWAGFLVTEALRLPVTGLRVAASVRAARRMLAEGPRIPAVPALVTAGGW